VQLDQELQQARGELDRFRTRVIEHFTTTANLVNRLTSDYRAVHDHLSRGAQQLAGGQVPRLESLAPGEPQLVAPPIVVDELLEEIEEEEGVSARSASPSNRRAAPREGWYEDVAPGTEMPPSTSRRIAGMRAALGLRGRHYTATGALIAGWYR
jgi:hypothetical protein